MFEKLQKLLFEETDENEEEEYEPVVTKKEQVVTQQVTGETPRPTMQRIDVTQSFDLQSIKGQEVQPTVQHAEPKPIPAEPAVVEKPKSIGLTIDELSGESKPQPAPVASRKQAAQVAKKDKPRKPAAVYEFQPVISPIFGVDEKDVDQLQTSGKPSRTSGREDNSPKVISPMYGTNLEAEPSSIQTTVEKSDEIERLSMTSEKVEAEDDVPEFSLDDILKVRDEQYSQQAPVVESTQQTSLFDNLEETVDVPPVAQREIPSPVVDVPLQEEEEEIDQTVIFPRNDDFPSAKGE